MIDEKKNHFTQRRGGRGERKADSREGAKVAKRDRRRTGLICGIQLGVSSEAATKQDLADAVRQVTEKFSRDLGENTEKLIEAIRDSQTEWLRGFYEWARPVDVRLRHADELVQRMGWLEDRISRIERGDPPSTH
jgi:hypothetical protein